MHFYYTPGISDDRVDLKKGEAHDAHLPINLHLDCDNFVADLVAPQEVQEVTTEVKDEETGEKKEIKFNKQVYVSKRMVPPGDHQYFFSIAG